MKKEYDFSKGVRGKFHNQDGELHLPIYLDHEIAEFLQKLSVENKMDRNQIEIRSLISFFERIWRSLSSNGQLAARNYGLGSVFQDRI